MHKISLFKTKINYRNSDIKPINYFSNKTVHVELVATGKKVKCTGHERVGTYTAFVLCLYK